MTYPATSWFGQALVDALANTVALDLNSDVFKVALYNDAFNGAAFDKNNNAGTISVSPWNANEVTSTNYTAGGAAIGAVPTVTAAAGKLVWSDQNATLVWTNVTFAPGPRGALIYDDTISPKRGIVTVNFGADIPVTAGTFTVTWDPTNKLGAITF